MANTPTIPLAGTHWLPKLLALLLLLAATTAPAQTAYYWRGATGASLTAAASWNTQANGSGTTRSPALATDILVFDGGAPVVTVAGLTIARLRFINNTSVTLNSASNSTNTISVSGDATDDGLIVESGSAVTLVANGTTGGSAGAGVVISLGAGTTGRVAGTITLTNVGTAPPTATNKLASATENALRFAAGGQLIVLGSRSSTAFSGVPVFESGSTLEQNAPNSSDRSAATSASYRSGSTFRYVDGVFGGTGLSVDRTFGNLEFASATGRTIGGALNLTILNNLAVTGGGGLVLAARGNAMNPAGTLVGGNIDIANAAATLNFNPSTAIPNAPKVSFNSSSAQTVSSAGTLSFGPNTKLEINNPAGVTLQADLGVAHELLLTNGLLTTNASGSGLLTLAATATVVGGSSSSFVNGPLARPNAPGSSSLLFPVGRVAPAGSRSYRPITLALTSQTNTVTYTAQQVEGSGAASGVTAPIGHVSARRYYTVGASAAPAGGSFAARISLSFGPDNYVNNATTAALVVARRSGGTWSSIGSANTGPGVISPTPLTGTLTSGAFTSFSDFTLASTAANGLYYPGLNPLPVALARFGATAQQRRGPALGHGQRKKQRLL